ncbi:MAG: hypothetical protein AAFP90_20110 [Planctomycetota bacterium]
MATNNVRFMEIFSLNQKRLNSSKFDDHTPSMFQDRWAAEDPFADRSAGG